MTMLLIGHRGCHYAGYNQNTLRAFTKVITEGVAAIEFDVQLSSDGVPVIVHNLNLEEVSTGVGLVNKTDSGVLRSIFAGDPRRGEDRIPFLPELFELFAGISPERRPRLHMELKGDGSSKPAGELTQEYITAGKLRQEDFLVSSFNWNELKEIRTILPQIDIALLDGAIHRSRLLAKTGNKAEKYFAEIFSYGCEEYMLPHSAKPKEAMAPLLEKCKEETVQKIIAREIQTCLAGGYYTDELLDTACAMKAISINLWHKTISPQFVEKAHRRGLKVFVYTANNSDDLLAAVKCGVDGIFTDHYLQAKATLASP